MGEVIKFPTANFRSVEEVEDSPFNLKTLAGIPAIELMDGVFQVNFDYLGIAYGAEAADCVEFYTDDRWFGKALLDVDNMPHRPDVRGMYMIDLDTYELTKINDEPLKYFLNN